ncbi:primosomal protein N' [Smaragdicoccus niigatensis]|uniref:primosomal protein N' n=1 Tax=Smaragdicoccus niigatensis TaxID=359359 RepID=UPI00157B9AC0
MSSEDVTKAAVGIARILPLLSLSHLDRAFDYVVAPEQDAEAQPGVRVRVRFAGRLVDGYVLERVEESTHKGKLGRIDRVVSPEVVLPPATLELVSAVAKRYAGTRADVLRLAIPPRHARVEAETFDAPAAFDGPAIDGSGWSKYVRGPAFVDALQAGRAPRAAWQAVPGEDWPQRIAELAATVAAAGKCTVVVVPDQRDLVRVRDACSAVLGAEHVVGLSAELGPAKRYRAWLSAVRGSASVVVGTRSASFTPVRELGLIVIWDDGDDNHADQRAPYPHAREVALLRAHQRSCAFVAAGFARTAEVQSLVQTGWAHDLVAERAVLREYMPKISAPGDSDKALERDPLARAIRVPAVAFETARNTLAANEPVLIQVPRRGYVPTLACTKCRTPARCRRCNGPLSQAGGGSLECRWCGVGDAGYRCPTCGSQSLRAVVIGAERTAEEFGRAFPGAVVNNSAGSEVLSSVKGGKRLVVATIGAEPPAEGGYGAALLLDGWTLLARPDLRATEEALRRWMNAAALVKPGGRVIIVADPAAPTVQALIRWDPVGHAVSQLDERTEVRFPPAARMGSVSGSAAAIASFVETAKLPDVVEVLGPVPINGGEERLLLRVPRNAGTALSKALADAQAIRSAKKDAESVRVQVDPVDIG